MVYIIHSSSSRAAMPHMQADADADAAAAVAAGGEFVEGWLVAQLLGEGAYGEVRLLVHARSGACVALKVSRGAAAAGRGEGDAAAAAAREAALHRALRHPHVLRCLGARAQPPAHYTFLEYAAGGDLFDRIEPDVGMPERAARRYFAQLLAALRYLHERGVAHRDVKPENLLLDHKDDLKLSDFGLATLFRHGARERLLSRVCGTLPYAAPEVLGAAERAYRAPPADLWAAAVALVAMLAGELPWERALPSDARFAAWALAAERSPPAPPPPPGPWRKIRGAARALLRRALRPAPERRAALPQLQRHRWLQPDELDSERSARAWRSQPPPAAAAPAAAAAAAPDLSAADMDALISYSQPSRAADLLLAGAASQDATQTDAWARLGARLTRVRVAGARAAALERATDALRAAGLCARTDRGTLVVECCGEEVRMRAWAVPEPREAHSTLLEFRRARGCGLRFQRLFREARRALRPLAPPAPGPCPPAAGPEPMDEA